MNNKYITSFILSLIVFSSFLYVSNTSSESESAITTSTTLVEETSTTTSPSTTKVEETSTTTSLVPISKIAVSEDSESVQIISNEDDEVVSMKVRLLLLLVLKEQIS